ncbi:uncharacterized protein LOC116245856 [Nymphaea colorata]|nr:uncharacterized protein LOC116245856 [Nymphaea colorata]
MDEKSVIVAEDGPSAAASQLSAVLFDQMQQAQAAYDNMLKMISEIDRSSSEITEEVGKCKEWAIERKKMVEEEKERFRVAALSALDLLNTSGP